MEDAADVGASAGLLHSVSKAAEGTLGVAIGFAASSSLCLAFLFGCPLPLPLLPAGAGQNGCCLGDWVKGQN